MGTYYTDLPYLWSTTKKEKDREKLSIRCEMATLLRPKKKKKKKSQRIARTAASFIYLSSGRVDTEKNTH